MKLIIRADDLGISEAVNLGIRKSIVDGLINNVGLMTNMETSKNGYETIKDQDVALGLHVNICLGKPVSDPQYIPSLVQSDGTFFSSREIRARNSDTVNQKEAQIEVAAQLQRFIEITGRTPDYIDGHAVFSSHFFKAIEQVAKRHHLFFSNPIIDKEWEKKNGIYGFGFAPLDERGLYDPKIYLLKHKEEMKKHSCSIVVFHPGFLDQYILTHSSYTLIRAMECDFLCSSWFKKWIKDNDIELVDFRDFK